MADGTPPPEERDPSPPAQTSSPLHEVLAEDPLQVDDAIDDADSAFGESDASSTLTSLKSSILDYEYAVLAGSDAWKFSNRVSDDSQIRGQYPRDHTLRGLTVSQNGRRYHAFKAGSYFVPNDEQEQDRMDMVHHIYCLLLGGQLFLAPLGDRVNRVLDLGTGTGIWAMNFADLHPASDVTGVDLSPIQPIWVPPNCTFEVDDFESDWLYRQPFDYIHGRELEGCIADVDRLFEQAFQHLSSGGYIEMQTVDGEFLSDDDTAHLATNAQSWIQSMLDGARKFGKPLDGISGWKEKLENAGFVDVEQKIYKFPIGPWPKDAKLKEIGRWQYWQELQVVESYTHGIYSRVLGWDKTEIEVFKAKVKNDFKNPSIHIYLPVCILWGRKP